MIRAYWENIKSRQQINQIKTIPMVCREIYPTGIVCRYDEYQPAYIQLQADASKIRRI